MQALALAHFDVNRGALDAERRREIRDTVQGLLDDLADHEDPPPDETETDRPSSPALPVLDADALAPAWRNRPVLCVAGRGPLDEAAALLLAQLLERHGIGARVASCEAASAANVMELEAEGVEIAVASYLDARSLTNARYLVRRLRRRLPRASVICAFWTMTPEQVQHRDAASATAADEIVTTLREALERILDQARRAAEASTAEARSAAE
jgi:hypothetical protein